MTDNWDDRAEREELNALVSQAQGGDLNAFESIVRRFQHAAVATCYAWLGNAYAEDAAQEAFIEAYRSLPQLREPAAFSTWFRLILRKHCDRVRRKERPTLPIKAAETLPSSDDPGVSFEVKETAHFVHAALIKLSVAEREAVLLFHFAELPQGEIASFLGVSVDTVKNRLRSARHKLKKGLAIMTDKGTKPGAPSADFTAKVMRILRAVTQDSAAEIGAMLDADPALVSAEGEHPYWLGKPVVPPIVVATEWGKVDTVRELLDHGADPNWAGKSADRWSALQLAIHHGRPEHLEVAKLLIARGATIDIWAAAAMGDAERVSSRLAANPSLVSAMGPNNAPPLHFAATPKVVDILLGAGADPGVRDKYKQIAIERIASYGARRQAAGKRLMAVMRLRDVFLSCALGDLDEVKKALNAEPALVRARKADALTASVLPNGVDAAGEMLLHIASRLGHEEIVRTLIEHGADVNARAGGGIAPMHIAAGGGHTGVVGLLLDNGGDIDAVEDLHRSTPLGWARFQRRDETQRLLKARGARAD